MTTTTEDRTNQTDHSDRLSKLFAARFADQPAWAAVTEVFIGLGWLRAATSKIIDPSWWSGDHLAEFSTRDSAVGAPSLVTVGDHDVFVWGGGNPICHYRYQE